MYQIQSALLAPILTYTPRFLSIRANSDLYLHFNFENQICTYESCNFALAKHTFLTCTSQTHYIIHFINKQIYEKNYFFTLPTLPLFIVLN